MSDKFEWEMREVVEAMATCMISMTYSQALIMQILGETTFTEGLRSHARALGIALEGPELAAALERLDKTLDELREVIVVRSEEDTDDQLTIDFFGDNLKPKKGEIN